MSPIPYVIITPVRNEESNLPRTIESCVAQTIRPVAWIIVDDGSGDRTGAIADAAAAQYPWIHVVHRHDRGFRQPGTGVIEAFRAGFDRLPDIPWDFLVKLDGDLAFEPDYFEACLARFQEQPRLGIGGGVICQREGDRVFVESAGDPVFHVRGATKIYRRECWEEIGGLITAPGWDTVDELKANMLSWKTCTFGEIPITQLKETGSADGSWQNWVKNGLANYNAGYHPLFMLIKCGKRLFARPYGLGAGALAWGFLRGYLSSAARIRDKDLIEYVHDQQFRKLTLRPSIWTTR